LVDAQKSWQRKMHCLLARHIDAESNHFTHNRGLNSQREWPAGQFLSRMASAYPLSNIWSRDESSCPFDFVLEDVPLWSQFEILCSHGYPTTPIRCPRADGTAHH
jgi:hypothetical protein